VRLDNGFFDVLLDFCALVPLQIAGVVALKLLNFGLEKHQLLVIGDYCM